MAQIHVVQPGDTVFLLSRRYGVSQEDLIVLNQLPFPDQLVVGQTLLIRSPEVGSDLERLGFVYPFVSPWVLRQTLPYVTAMGVFSYGFREDGTPVPPLLSDALVLALIRTARKRPALVLTPTDSRQQFNNALASRMLNDPQARGRLIANLLAVMEEKDFEELNVDFEYILPEDREAFTAFVTEAAAAMHAAGHRISVCLAPKTSRQQRGLLYESHDYAALAEPVDYVVLMTYEWGYKYGPPLAVAPLDRVRQVAEYALTEIPAEKILLGIPNYGYDWPLPYIRGLTVARTIGNVEAVRIAWNRKAEIQFDDTAQSPWFQYTDDGVRHVVWFEDLRSWQAKLDLVRELGGKGLAIWQNMQLWRAGLMVAAQ